jgi:hypothetical protein
MRWGEKKPPGVPAVGLVCWVLLAYARLPLQPPVRGENQKYAKKKRETHIVPRM